MEVETSVNQRKEVNKDEEIRIFICPLNVGFLMSDPEFLADGFRNLGFIVEDEKEKTKAD